MAGKINQIFRYLAGVSIVAGSYCSGSYAGWSQEAVIQYAQGKILDDCLGTIFVQSWKESVAASTEKCFGEEPMGMLPDMKEILARVLKRRKSSSKSTRLSIITKEEEEPSLLYNFLNDLRQNQHPPHMQMKSSVTPHMLSHYLPPALEPQPQTPWYVFSSHKTPVPPPAAPLHPHYMPGYYAGRRKKRSLEHTQESPNWRTVPARISDFLDAIPKINKFRTQLRDRVSNVTCVLKSMELLDEDGLPNYRYNTKLIEHLKIDEELRESLLEVQDFCREFSMCVPVHRMSNVLVREVGYSLVFMKCLKEKIIQACVKHDTKEPDNIFDFDISNLISGMLPSQGKSSYASKVEDTFKSGAQGVESDIMSFFSARDDIAFGF